jgi:DNA-binding Lrp family transcriptional regulator
MSDEARDVVRQLRRLAARAAQAQADLHEAIRLSAGRAPQRAVADAVNLSKTRVNQIVHGRSR